MSIKNELKRLYTSMCGGTTSKDGTAAIIGDIADNYAGGGSDLPEVSGDDNGKVLTVVSGEWDKATAPSGMPVPNYDNDILVSSSGAWVEQSFPLPLPDIDYKYKGMVVTDSGAATWGGINEIVPCQYDAQNHSLTILIEPVTIIELYQKDRPTVISASGLTLWLAYAYGDPSNYAFRFVGYDYTDHKIAYADFANSTTATVVLCPLVPAYDSTNDVGKSLKVGASGLEWG